MLPPPLLLLLLLLLLLPPPPWCVGSRLMRGLPSWRHTTAMPEAADGTADVIRIIVCARAKAGNYSTASGPPAVPCYER